MVMCCRMTCSACARAPVADRALIRLKAASRLRSTSPLMGSPAARTSSAHAGRTHWHSSDRVVMDKPGMVHSLCRAGLGMLARASLHIVRCRERALGQTSCCASRCRTRASSACKDAAQPKPGATGACRGWHWEAAAPRRARKRERPGAAGPGDGTHSPDCRQPPAHSPAQLRTPACRPCRPRGTLLLPQRIRAHVWPAWCCWLANLVAADEPGRPEERCETGRVCT